MEENITIFHFTIFQLEDKITNYIKLGYVVAGEISTLKYNSNLYCQSMILKSQL